MYLCHIFNHLLLFRNCTSSRPEAKPHSDPTILITTQYHHCRSRYQAKITNRLTICYPSLGSKTDCRARSLRREGHRRVGGSGHRPALATSAFQAEPSIGIDQAPLICPAVLWQRLTNSLPTLNVTAQPINLFVPSFTVYQVVWHNCWHRATVQGVRRKGRAIEALWLSVILPLIVCTFDRRQSVLPIILLLCGLRKLVLAGGAP